MRRDLRNLGDHDGVEVADLEPSLGGEFPGACHEDRAVGALPGWIRIRKLLPERPQARRAEHRVGDGMKQSVSIGMALQTSRMTDLQSPQAKPFALGERMRVETESNSRTAHARLPSKLQNPESEITSGSSKSPRRSEGPRES